MSKIIAELRSLQSVEGQPLGSTRGDRGIPTESSALERHKHGIRWPKSSRRLAVPSARDLFEAPFFCHAPSTEVTAHSPRLFRGPPASATGCTCGHSNRGTGIRRGRCGKRRLRVKNRMLSSTTCSLMAMVWTVKGFMRRRDTAGTARINPWARRGCLPDSRSHGRPLVVAVFIKDSNFEVCTQVTIEKHLIDAGHCSRHKANLVASSRTRTALRLDHT